MRLIVSGAGRGGTNLLTELLRKVTDLNFTSLIEDRDIMRYTVLPTNYATKLATENIAFSKKNMSKLMNQHDDLYIVFSLRHPIDNCLSKIARGQKSSDGGDKQTENISSDGTVEASIRSITSLYDKIKYLQGKYPHRVTTCKMEEVILNPGIVCDKLLKFMNINKSADHDGFQSNNRNQYQKSRYGASLDKSQINLYKDPACFEGFFENNNTIETLKKKLEGCLSLYYG